MALVLKDHSALGPSPWVGLSAAHGGWTGGVLTGGLALAVGGSDGGGGGGSAIIDPSGKCTVG